MSAFSPKSVPSDNWKKLIPSRDYAVVLTQDKFISIRVGTGVGLYMKITLTKSNDMLVTEVEYQSGEEAGQTVVPKDELAVLGRVDGCKVMVKHALISRNHLQICYRHGVFMVRDLNSTNGTYINNTRLFFDIKEYIDKHPPEQNKDGTLDLIHQEFGPILDDFLIKYKEGKI